jgi:hypothetical protein
LKTCAAVVDRSSKPSRYKIAQAASTENDGITQGILNATQMPQRASNLCMRPRAHVAAHEPYGARTGVAAHLIKTKRMKAHQI